MFNKSYSNFVKASSPERCRVDCEIKVPFLSGEEARRLYLREVKGARSITRPIIHNISEEKRKVHKEEHSPVRHKDLYETVQNNDIVKLKCILDKHPDKINVIDDYGWSLLMIACQANSVECAKELLKRGIDLSVRDKAGNSARSLVIKNKNHALVDALLEYKTVEDKEKESKVDQQNSKHKTNEEYMCNICNKIFPDKEVHLSSTIHNISASKGKKIPANYVIPASNKGYQLMLKGGWDRDSGLGKDGSGKKYPIKPIQKKDRKGLGHDKRKQDKQSLEDKIKCKSKKMFQDNYRHNRQFEINFRREFY